MRALKSLLFDLLLPWMGVAVVLSGVCLLMATGFAGFFAIVGLWFFAWFWLLMGLASRGSPERAVPGTIATPTPGVSS